LTTSILKITSTGVERRPQLLELGERREIGLHPLEKHIVIEQFIELSQFGFELKVRLGDQLEEVHGIVAIDYHGGWLRSCGIFAQKNPTGAACFAPQTSTTSLDRRSPEDSP
jgi:hypothetical protein